MTNLNPTTAVITELVFIDGSLSDIDILVAAVKPGARVVVLDPAGNGLAQMASIAAGYSGLTAIHVVSHGAAGQIQLGSATLSQATLAQQSADMAALGAALAPGGDLLIYGCDVAAGQAGADFVQALATATGADVAASSDITGAARLGGNWALEHVVGDIETANLEVSVYNSILLDLIFFSPYNYIYGTEGNDNLVGGTGLDRIYGYGGSDALNGGAGDDSMYGGAGNDTYYIDTTADTVVEYAGEGTSDWVYVGGVSGYSLPNEVENLYQSAASGTLYGYGNEGGNYLWGGGASNVFYGFGGNDTLYGFAGNDSLYGGNGDDTVDGGTGVDSMNGGDGSDTYYVDDIGDIVAESYNDALGGVDTVYSSAAYHFLGNGIEHLTLTGSAAINGYGNENANNMIGNSAGNYLFGYGGQDTLNGGAGIDTLYGGTGDDLYLIDSSSESLNENAGEGNDSVESSVGYQLAVNIENLTLTGSGNHYAYGNASDNVLIGNSGSNTLWGGTGADTMQGMAGDDAYYVDSESDVVSESLDAGNDWVYSVATYTLGANIENLYAYGSATINATGNELANNLTGNDANNVLDGAAGIDTLAGNYGDDTYIVDNAADSIVEYGSAGYDRVKASVTFTIAPFADVEELELTGTASIYATGNDAANLLIGNTGNNRLDGGAGADTLRGGAGNDTYTVDNSADVVQENLSEGADIVNATVSYVLADNIERLNLLGTDSINATGNGTVNTLQGNSGNNVLDGQAGRDTLIGGDGDDTFIVDNINEVITENANAGNDTARSSAATFTLAANVENLVLTGTAAINGTGNDLANTITGNSGANTIVGGLGNDTIAGAGGLDQVVYTGNKSDYAVVIGPITTVTHTPSGEIDTLTGIEKLIFAGNLFTDLVFDTVEGGTSGADNLVTGGGNDTLGGNDTVNAGLGGVDTMDGGAGDDVYYVSQSGSIIIEEDDSASGGIDKVKSSVSFNLDFAGNLPGFREGVEMLDLTGSANINGIGNTADNTLTGNIGNNLLDGLMGDDTLRGGGGLDTLLGFYGNDLLEGNNGADSLMGEEGNDTLDGGAGVDTMLGGAGDDTYYIDNSDDSAQEAVETSEGGIDTIYTVFTTTLGFGIENLVMQGSANVALTGNALANRLEGNSGSNTITGGAGIDTLIGGGGDDFYLVDSSNDMVIEGVGEGYDYVLSFASFDLSANIEYLSLEGSGDLTGTGNSLANYIYGNTGNNTLDGAGGADTLIGREGDDIYRVDNAGDSVFEYADEGTDGVRSSVSYTLTNNVENLLLLDGATNGTGNTLANKITGNAAANTLAGLEGNDLLLGRLGDDTLIGGAGNDTLAGGDGNNTVIYAGNASDFVFGVNEGGGVIVTDAGSDGIDEGTDLLVKVQTLQFGDGHVYTLEAGQAAGDIRVSASGPGVDYGTSPEIALLSDGAYVVTWEKSGDVFTQRYNAFGQAQGTAVQVSSFNWSWDSDITAMADGGYLVTFVDYVPATFGYRVVGKRFDADGNPNPPVAIEIQTAGGQPNGPVVTALSNGGFAVAWFDYNGSNYDVRAAVFDANNVAVPSQPGSGMEIASSASYEYNPSITALASGGFIAAWFDNDPAGEVTPGMYARQVDDLGTPVGSVFRLNPENTFAYQADVINLQNGSFVAVWQSYDGDGDGIYGRLFTPTGGTWTGGTEFRLNTEFAGGQAYAAVTALTDGGFVAVWEAENLEGGGASIHGQRFDATGNLIGAEFTVSTNGMDDHRRPKVATDPDGGFVVTWKSEQFDGLDSGIFAQRYDAQGNTTGGLRLNGSNLADSISIAGSTQTIEVRGLAGDDWLTGSDLNDILDGGDGNDSLVGGQGDDTLQGAAGDDTYTVDSLNDQVIEIQGEGVDTVLVKVDHYVLSEGAIENVMLDFVAPYDPGFATAPPQITGNSSANQITGNQHNNTLAGAGGDDTLRGGQGADTAVFSDELSAYVFGVDDHGLISVRHTVEGGADGTDYLSGIQKARFAPTGNAANGQEVSLGSEPLVNSQFLASNPLDYFSQNSFGSTVTSRGNTLLMGTTFPNSGGTALTLLAVGPDGETQEAGGALRATVAGEAIQRSTIAAFAGGAVAVWEMSGPANTHFLEGQLLNPDGTLNGGVFAIGGPLAAYLDHLQVESTPDGGFAIAWSEQSDPVNNIQYFGAGGAVAGAPIAINTGGYGMELLANGESLVASGFSNDVLRYNTAGGQIGGAIALDSSIAYADVSTLSTGNWVVTWTSELNGIDFAYARLYAPDWSPLTAAFFLNSDAVIDPNDIRIGALPDGSFVAVWSAGPYLNADIFARRFAADGTPLAAQFRLNTEILGRQSAPEISVHADGSFDVFWVTDVGDDVVGQRFDADGNKLGGLQLAGSAMADNLNASDATASVRIIGLQGGDSLTGGSAADTLEGGDGNDTLDGNGGIDSLVGGTGNDIFIYEGESDIFRELEGQGLDAVWAYANYVLPETSIENIVLKGSAERATGNNRGNVITGSELGNLLDGGAGADTLRGGLGDDTYVVDNLLDNVEEAASSGQDTVQTSVTYVLPVNIENVVLLGLGAIHATGNDLANLIVGNTAANTLTGGLGDDIYDVDSADTVVELANGGNDTVRTATTFDISDKPNIENIEIRGNANVQVEGNSANNLITGNIGNNRLDGLAGNDTLIGGGGIDTLSGSFGDDLLAIDSVDDVIVEKLNQGNDTVTSTVSVSLMTLEGGDLNVENLTLVAGSFALTATGNALANVITGNGNGNTLTGLDGNDTLVGLDGDDLLDGGLGADSMNGGQGSDIYEVNDVGDVAFESDAGASGGIDQVRSTLATYTLGANVENLLLLGSGNFDGTGNELANQIEGNGGDNELNGQGGADRLVGHAGDDSYYIDNLGDVVEEADNEGFDTVYTTLAGYVLTANVERLVLITTTALDAMGNNLNNVLLGNTAPNNLDGGLGADTMEGGKDDDTYTVDNTGDVVIEFGGQGYDTILTNLSMYYDTLGTVYLPDNVENLELTGSGNINGRGNFLSNIIYGNIGNNIIDGGLFVDVLIGKAGDDTYVVDSGDDIVIELASEGSDTIQSSVTYTLPANVEKLDLTGTDNIDATGNALQNRLTGNSGNNYLKGLVGNDTLAGEGGNDTLDGGSGADSMNGGDGADVYFRDNASDIVVETNSGTGADQSDLVQSTLSYILVSNVENLQLLGSGNLTGTGNSLSNQLIGNDGNNLLTGLDGDDLLKGGLGVDTMVGGQGNDIYYVDSNADVVTETAAQGIDIVYVSSPGTGLNQDPLNGYVLPNHVENVIYFDPNLLFVVGNGLNNYFTGNDGNNTLDGAGGADTMEGGAGNDVYIVENLLDSVIEAGSEGVDEVQASIDFTLSDNVENLVLTGAALEGTGNSGNNNLKGNTGNNLLNGGSGADSLQGGAGDDTYIVDNVGDMVNETMAGSTGVDKVISSVALTLADGVENLELAGLENLYAGGNDDDNEITGNNGNNVIDGGDGIDTANYGAAGGGVNANLATGSSSGAGGQDTLLDIENLDGSSYGDTLTGSESNNVIDGSDGNDTMSGGHGNDVYYVDDAGDVVIELDNDIVPNTAPPPTNALIGFELNLNLGNIDTVFASVLNFTLPANLEVLIQTGVADAVGTGNELVNVMTGNDGNNILDGMLGNDTLRGGVGDDTLLGGDGVDNIDGGIGNDSLTGGAGADTFFLAPGSLDVITDFLVGTGGDQLDISSAVATFTGFTTGTNPFATGHLRLRQSLSNVFVEIDTDGSGAGVFNAIGILKNAVATDVTGANFVGGYAPVASVAITGTTGADNLVGAGGNDSISGLGGNDTLNGGAGDDTLTGGAGNDSLIGSTGIDTAVYTDAISAVVANLSGTGSATGGSGTDTLSGIENLIGGNFNDSLTGSTAANRLEGGAGNDTLNGSTGIDTMLGGAGDDQYTVDNALDVVTEGVNAGIDSILSSIDFTLGANQENLRITAAIGGNGTGNTLANIITAGAGDNLLDGASGNDTVSYALAGAAVVASLTSRTATGGSGADTLNNFENILGSNYSDSLTGNTLANRLEGAGGADTLNGGTGADTMIGGSGSDQFFVENAGDVVTEVGSDALSGTDIVYSQISYTLGDNVENLRINTSNNVDATGNTLDNVLFAGAGNNVLSGLAGLDTANYGNTAGAVNISLQVAGAQATGNSGSDTLVSIENLTGSNYNDTLAGNAADNVMEGGVGTDTITYAAATGAVVVSLSAKTASGADGNDTLLRFENIIGSGFDDVITGSSVANLLNGGAGADTLTGSSGNDTLLGGEGNDLLIGSANQDSLTGGNGADTFDLNSVAESADAALSWDIITDFSRAQNDKIDLSTLDADTGTTGNQAFTYIGSAAFSAAAQVRYDAGTGMLYGSVDADATAEFAIQLIGLPALVAADFIL